MADSLIDIYYKGDRKRYSRRGQERMDGKIVESYEFTKEACEELRDVLKKSNPANETHWSDDSCYIDLGNIQKLDTVDLSNTSLYRIEAHKADILEVDLYQTHVNELDVSELGRT